MAEPAELNSIIDEKIKNAVAKNQNDILQNIDRLMANRFENFQRSVHENQRKLSETQMSKIEQMNTEAYVFKRKGNEEQYKVNTKIANKMKEAKIILTENPDANEHTEGAFRNITEGLDILTHRQKLIKLADQSENGWRTVSEYETHSLADDSEDEKRIIRAENKAARKAKSDKRFKPKSVPYSTPQSTRFSNASQPNNVQIPVVNRPGKCYECGVTGHWRSDHYRQPVPVQREKTDKISTNLVIDKSETESIITPVGRLRNSFDYWQGIDGNETVLDIIKHGYKIPFYTDPEEVCLKNNKSALDNTDFVDSEISKLLRLGCVKQVFYKPKVVNPLTVAANKDKLRMVLDCRHINPHLHKFKFKYEDASVASQIFKKDDYCFTYDLRSAYHHIEIFEQHKTYLGFAWYYKDENITRYFVFNVLPFGISTAGYIFTKVLRCIVKYLRSMGLKVVMYLDDGIGGAESIVKARYTSFTVQSVLQSAGFLIADDKCNWEPCQRVVWLGLVWHLDRGIISVTERRTFKLLDTLNQVIFRVGQGELKCKARFLASIVGQIISMQVAVGPTVRLRTRSMYECILYRASWNATVLVGSKALDELVFWKENIESLNGRELNIVNQFSSVVYTDASGVGYGGYVVNTNDNEIIGSWNVDEKLKSSTWRELEAVYRVLQSIVESLEGETVKWYTDNQNVVHIINKGSKKCDLQNITIKIANLCMSHNINIIPEWIPRQENTKADEISKSLDCDDWGINDETYIHLNSAWGPHTVDRFATDYNTKCSVFNSKHWCHGTFGIDAFNRHWGKENNWMVPPPSDISRCVNKIKQDQVIGTLIIPLWPSAPYWPLLHTFSDGRANLESFVKDSQILTSNVINKGRGRNGVFGNKPSFNMLALKIRF